MKSLYYRLAADGIRRHSKLYSPFVGTTVFFIVLINICLSVYFEPALDGMFGRTTITTLTKLGAIILSIFTVISLLRNYSFIQKRKADEAGLYLILGMEKKHLNKMTLIELINLYLKSILLGTVIAAIVYRFFLAIFIKLTKNKAGVFASGILPSIKPLAITALIFLVIFALIYIDQIYKFRNFSPISYVNESKAGQKPPRFPVIKGLLGVVFIGIGYYIALTVQNPIEALKYFFIAVVFVIAGTFMAFSVIVSGVLKLLKNNKKFYYKKSNFTAVSGLIYRVKNSANTLASIAILSTMVIVVLTSGFSLFFGADDMLDRFYPSDYIVELREVDDKDKYIKSIEQALKKEGEEASLVSYTSNFLPVDIKDGVVSKINGEISFDDLADLMKMGGVSLIYYDNVDINFGDADAILVTEDDKQAIKKVDEHNLKIKQMTLEDFPYSFSQPQMDMGQTKALIFRDFELYKNIEKYLKPNDEYYFDETDNLLIDTKGAYNPELKGIISEAITRGGDTDYGLKDSYYSRNEFYEIFAGIFFVGLILGLGFLVSTVLAIYYKQLEEGLVDMTRFKTMRQLGMTDDEAKKSIAKQMRLVFILPLIFAFTHTSFAMPIITKLLYLVGLTNKTVFIKCMLAVFLAYAVFYFITYKLTAKTYKNLVLE